MSSGLPQMPPLAQGSMGSSKSAKKKAEIQRDRAAPGTKSKSGFQVEYRSDGYYYMIAVPKHCKDIKVGDRVLEINGVKSFNFQSARRANDLFDTLYLIYHSKEEEAAMDVDDDDDDDDDNDNDALSAENRAKGRRSKFEEEARQIGADRRDYKKNIEKQKILEQQEREIRRAELEQRRMERERRKAEEAMNAPPSPPPVEPKRGSVSVESNVGVFSPKPSHKGWSKVVVNHKKNG